MNNIDIIKVNIFNFLSGEFLPYCDSVIQVIEYIPYGGVYMPNILKFEYNTSFKILKIFSKSNIQYCSNTIEIKYFLNVYAQRKAKIEKLLSNEKSK